MTDQLGNTLGGGDFVRSFTVDAVPDGAVFEGRDNDTFDKATPLQIEADSSGSGWLRSELGWGSGDPVGDIDWWSFTAEAGDFIDVWSQEQVGGDRPFIDLYALRSDGNGVTHLSGNQRGGPGDTAYISGFEAPADNTYFVRVVESGGYDVRVHLYRGMSIETDAHGSNDSTGQADPLTFTQQGNTSTASVAGTVMSIADEDIYQLGFLNAGTSVALDALTLPEWSLLEPEVSLFRIDPTNSSNWLYVDDTDASDALFDGTIADDGTYFAQVRTRTGVFESRRYTLHDASLTWTEAQAVAIDSGGHLASIGTAQEQAFLTTTFGTDYWIGLNDIDTEGMFAWTDGTPLNYENWYLGHPDNAGNSNGNDFAYMSSNDGGTWYVTHSNTHLNDSLIETAATPFGPMNSRPGIDAQYVLDVTVADLVLPVVAEVSRLPEEGGSTNEVLSTFSVSFSEALNETTLADGAFDLRTAGTDGQFDTADDIVYDLAFTYSSGQFRIDFTVNDGPLLDDVYRFTISEDVTDQVG
ncbi:MAG: lectin-like protein, partial [Pirellulaceae bacterium]